ncbi:ABC transporter substrate-binding protein [Tessaracoccus sp. OH4464_COT-324]|uniref:ABC transporter substrate-binding protein n=1 Tax=Tessaracoccus sp. OH4464_COT-324 TaxID=2491059 RepID=UPI000F6407EC|nr:extracellular solute-binding protein [Tessaracoccus sp. OH4464_COT-324]RRD46830.1 extracellular solute-binding protein [Tessaracoccus sp. OH4464_COT-324]
MKRMFKLGAMVLASAFALSACGGGDTAPAAGDGKGKESSEAGKSAATDLETTIKILAPSYAETSKGDWEKIIAEFNKSYPKVKVELQIEGWEAFTSKVQARIQAKDYPDILNDNNYATMAAGGLLYPVEEVMSKETIDLIEPKLLENGKGSDGKLWAVPDIASARLMAYNTGIFEKAGITEPPKTWDELTAAAKKIKDLNDGSYGYGLPLGEEEAQVETSLWLWGNGGEWGVDGKLTAKQDKAVEAFKQMKMMIDEGLTQPNVGSTNRQGAVDLFNNGKLGMLLMHTGVLTQTDKDFSDVKYKLAPVPSKDGKGVSYGVTDFIVAFNNQDEKRKEATKAFLDLMYSDKHYESWYKGTGLMPVTKNMIKKATADAGHFAPFYETLSSVSFQPVGNPEWDTLQVALQKTAGKLENNSPEQVLDEIQAQLDAQG